MKPVKTRILNAALALFNEHGSDAVSIRDVAEAVGMSPGNLCYHYKNTDALIHALYFRLSEESDARFSETVSDTDSFHYFLELMHDTYLLIDRYRFLFLDIVRIVRRSPEIHAHYLQLVARRKAQTRGFLHVLVQKGYAQPAILSEEYAAIVDVAIILGDYWLSHAQLLSNQSGEARVRQYMQIGLMPLRPFLTASGKLVCSDFFEDQTEV